MTAHDIYAQQLLHLGHGLPMWGPEPCPDFGEINLGDVGYLRDGYFRFLFNAMRSADDPVNARRGVPEGFEVFRPPEWTIVRRPNHITQSQLYSRSLQAISVSLGASADSGVGAAASAGLRYRCGDAAGALLMLKAPAHKTSLECRLHIQKYILAHLSRWCDFANGSLGLGLEEKDIIFVSGFTKTSVWAETAFNNSTSDGELVIAGGCFVPSLSGEFRVSMMQCTDYSVFARTGPYERVVSWTEEPGPSVDLQCDQSIFINFYKMKSRWWRSTVLRGAAGPHALPEAPDDEASPGVLASESEECEEVFDPVDCVLSYILAHSEASVACASDDDWMALFTDDNYPEDFELALETLSPPVEVNAEGMGSIVWQGPPRTQLVTPASLAPTSRWASGELSSLEPDCPDYSDVPMLSAVARYLPLLPQNEMGEGNSVEYKRPVAKPPPYLPYAPVNGVKLHWLLCPPFESHILPLKHFDSSKPVEDISVEAPVAPLRTSTPSDPQKLIERPASSPPLCKMVLQYHAMPQRRVHVSRTDGDVLRVRDVFKAIYDDLRTVMDPVERETFCRGRFEDASNAFVSRCNACDDPIEERRTGMRRMDILPGSTIFWGLTRPDEVDAYYWNVHFGDNNQRLPSPLHRSPLAERVVEDNPSQHEAIKHGQDVPTVNHPGDAEHRDEEGVDVDYELLKDCNEEAESGVGGWLGTSGLPIPRCLPPRPLQSSPSRTPRKLNRKGGDAIDMDEEDGGSDGEEDREDVGADSMVKIPFLAAKNGKGGAVESDLPM